MKKTKLSLVITVLLILVINFSGFSQFLRYKYKKELGLGFTDLLNSVDGGRQNFPIMNVSYKRVYNKNVFRSGITFQHYNDRQYTNNDQLFTKFLVNTGYERRFFDKKFQLLTGIDLVYSYTSAYNKTEIGYRSSTYQVGIGPVVGFIYRPTKRISLQAEFGLFYGPGKEKTTIGGKSTWTDKGSYLSSQRYLSFHIYYHFK